jgi:flagellar basal body-associated protein FliL
MDDWWPQIAERIIRECASELTEERKTALKKEIEDELDAAYSRGTDVCFHDFNY